MAHRNEILADYPTIPKTSESPSKLPPTYNEHMVTRVRQFIFNRKAKQAPKV